MHCHVFSVHSVYQVIESRCNRCQNWNLHLFKSDFYSRFLSSLSAKSTFLFFVCTYTELCADPLKSMVSNQSMKTAICTPLKSYIYFRFVLETPHVKWTKFPGHFRIFWKSVTNFGSNRSTYDDNVLIETETDIGTSLKYDIYFRFHSPQSTQSTLLNFYFMRNYVPIRWKTWWPDREKCQNRNSHTSKIRYLLQVFSQKNTDT